MYSISRNIYKKYNYRNTNIRMLLLEEKYDKLIANLQGIR